MLGRQPDLGAEEFVKARMGLGMFVFDVRSSQGDAPNRWMLHQVAGLVAGEIEVL